MNNEIESTNNVVQSPPVPHNDITTLAAGSSVALAGRVTGRMLYAVMQVILARLLGAETFGIYGIGWTVLLIIGTIAPMGLPNGVIRFGSRYWKKNNAALKNMFVQSLGLTLSSSLLIGSVLFLCAPWLAQQVFQKPDLTAVLRWFALAVPLVAGLRVAAAVTRISQRMKFSVYAEDLSQPAANLILVLFFYLLGWRLLGAVAAAVFSFGISLCLALHYIRNLFPEVFVKREKIYASARELFTFSLPTAFIGLFAVLMIRVDRLCIGVFSPAREVGIYHAASQLAVLFFIVLAALSGIFSPMIADLYHKGEMKRLEELFRVSTKWGIYLTMPVFLMICFAPHEMMTVIFGHEYVNGAWPLFILAIGMLINVGAGAVSPLLIMTGHQKRWLVIYSLMLTVNIILNWLLIPRLGMIGAALATAASMSGLSLSGLFQVKRTVGLWPYDYRYLKVLLANAAAIAVLFLYRLTAIKSQAFTLLWIAVISCCVFGGVLLLLGLDNEDREFIHLIRTRFVG